MGALLPLLLVGAAAYLLLRPRSGASDGPMPTGPISAHFTWEELTRTSTGLPNSPNSAARAQLVRLAGVLERIRTYGGDEPITVTSGYRSDAVNDAIGGAEGSYHLQGRAADIDHDGTSAEELATLLWGVRSALPLQEVIWYAQSRGGHVHVAIRSDDQPGTSARFMHAPAGGGYDTWSPE